MIFQELKDMLRGVEGPMEQMYRRRAEQAQGAEAMRLHEQAVIHRRLTTITRMLLCLTLALIAATFGDLMRGLAFMMERFG